ncbi:hypothetical protein D5086_006117, partial [Populus alba]
ELHNCSENDLAGNFLMDEIQVLGEAKGIELPNFLPRTTFLSILQKKKKVEKVSHIPVAFVEKFCLRNLVNKEMEEEIVQELVGRHDGAIERMLEESPAVAAKREKLNVSIKLLRESNNVLANIMDKIASNV